MDFMSKVIFGAARSLVAALAFVACLPCAAAACQITVAGSQPGLSNSAAVDCISIVNAAIAGDFNNSGSILQSGITVSTSTLGGGILNTGPTAGGNVTSFAGGISADKSSSIGSGGVIGIGLIGIPNFSGGITTAATITAGSGVYVDSVGSFAGGIVNTGQITAGNGFSISNISSFTGGATNTGKISSTNYGMSFLTITDFEGGIFNSGTIVSSGINRAGISLFVGSFAGGINNAGNISAAGAGITLGDSLCLCDPRINFAGGITNSGTIQGGFVGIAIENPTKFSGTINNSGSISGVTGLILFYSGPGGINVLNSGTITGTGGTAITFGAPGVLTLTSTSVINGTVLGFGSALQLGGSSAGIFDLSTLGTQYRDFASLNKIDSSTWTLTGSIAFAGPLNVTGGTLVVNGADSFSSTTVTNATLVVNGSLRDPVIGAGGVLTGTGSVNDTVIQNGGTFAPGSGVPGSSMTIAGNLAFQSGALYLVQINSSTSSFATVTATATLGGTVQAVLSPGSYSARQYDVFHSAGLGGTTFAGAVTNLQGFAATLSYDPTDVFLSLKAVLGAGAGLNANQQNVATRLNDFFNSGGTLPPAFTNLFALGGAGLASALTQISGELATAPQQTTFDAMSQFLGLLTDPFTGRGNGIDGATSATGFAEEGANAHAAGCQRTDAFAMFAKVPTAQFVPRWTVWASGFGGSQSTDGNVTMGSNNATSRIFGTAVGADYRLSPQTMAGFALAGGGTNFSVNNLGSGRSDLFQAGAYLRHANGAAYVSAAAAYGWQDITTDRNVMIAGLDHLRAEFNANAYSGRLESGYRFFVPVMGGLGITPYAAGQFTTFDLPAYTEQVVAGAPAFALNYAAKSVTDGRSDFGIRSDKSFAMHNGVLTLRGRLAWAHDFDPDRNVLATFQTLPGASFLVNGARRAADSALTTLSAEWGWIKGWSAAATFEGEFAKASSSYAGKGVVRYAW
jgi:uncharacterized protein with beta-barrel porin domain